MRRFFMRRLAVPHSLAPHLFVAVLLCATLATPAHAQRIDQARAAVTNPTPASTNQPTTRGWWLVHPHLDRYTLAKIGVATGVAVATAYCVNLPGYSSTDPARDNARSTRSCPLDIAAGIVVGGAAGYLVGRFIESFSTPDSSPSEMR